MTKTNKNTAQSTSAKAEQVRDEAQAKAEQARDQAKNVGETAKEQAVEIKETASDAAQQVVGQAKQEAGQVADEARDQIRGLIDTTLGEVRGRASEGQGAIAETVRGLSKELQQLTNESSANGPVAQFAGDIANRGESFAQWLGNTQPDDVLLEVRRFAARRPTTFLALAAGAGVIAGRLARGQRDLVQQEQELEQRRAQLNSQTYRQPTYGQQAYATPQPGYGQPAYGDPRYAAQQPGYATEQPYAQPGHHLPNADQAQVRAADLRNQGGNR